MFDVGTVPASQFLGNVSGVLQFLRSQFSTDRFFTNKCSAFTKSYAVTSSRWIDDLVLRKVGDEFIHGQGASFDLVFDVDWNLVKEVREAWKENADAYTYHRGRWAAIGAKRLMYNEHLVRLSRAALRPKVAWPQKYVQRAQEAWLTVMKNYKTNLSIGDHTDHYISEHRDSSVFPGLKWSDITEDQLKSIMSAVDSHLLDRIDAGIGTDLVIHPTNLHYGSRSRAPKPESIDTLDGPMTVGRTRIIMYKAGMSSANAFVPKKLKTEWYKWALNYVADGLGFKVLSPVTMGGQFYLELAEYMRDYKYIPTDGANWEINVPQIIPEILAYTVLGERVLPSGSFDTSLLGSLASLVRASEWIQQGITSIVAVTIMGDDLGVFVSGSGDLPTIPEISEIDALDMKFKHCLGWNYTNPLEPHPDGIKFTGDSPRGTQGGRVGQTVHVVQNRKLSYQEIRAVVGLYKGRLDDDRTFLDVIRDLPPSEEMYPRKIREWLTHDGRKESDTFQKERRH